MKKRRGRKVEEKWKKNEEKKKKEKERKKEENERKKERKKNENELIYQRLVVVEFNFGNSGERNMREGIDGNYIKLRLEKIIY